MLKLSFFTLCALMAAGAAWQAQASDAKEIESITVLADKRLAVPLSELASAFTHESMISVAVVFGDSAAQKKQIEDGGSADVFITPEPQMIQQLKIRGLVDVYSIGEIAALKNTRFVAAVVASENMTPAREFLGYLKSGEGKETLRRDGLETP